MSSISSFKGSILVVDDTTTNLRLLSDVLGGRGYEVRVASSGKQALRAVEHTQPDLILLDITMPEMDGYEVCRQLHAKEASRGIPVIFLTALTDTTEKVRAFDVGGVDYITKPFQVEEVLARVKTHLELKQTRDDLSTALHRLRELESLRDTLVQMVVHDMRSPLMVLKAHLSMLKSDLPLHHSDDLNSDVRRAMLAADRIHRMTNDLLDVSRLNEGKLPLNPEDCDLVNIAQVVSGQLSQLEPERELRLESSGPVHVFADRGVVTRVLENLVFNAIKHSPPETQVRIALTTSGAAARVSVYDQGPGVPAEVRTKIFDRFGAVEVRRNSGYHSAGLGLTFCKLALEASGGSIGIAEAATRGATFWFELPLAASAASRAE